MQPRKFCLIATERSGSNYVRELLGRLPGVVFYGELFNKVRFAPAKHIVDLGFSMADRDRNPLGFLAEVERVTFKQAAGCGFKLMIGHSPTVLNHVLESEEYRLIVMSRQNKLAQYSSLVIATTTGVWNVHRGDERGAEIKVGFDPNGFARFLAQDSRNYAAVWPRLKAKGRPCFGLQYAQIRDHDQIVALLEFMGIEPGRSISELIDRNPCVRQNAPRILDRFSNPEEVVSTMRKMGHEDWLIEEGP